MSFLPNVNDAIKVDGVRYRFTEHPSAKDMPYGQSGRRATVYQVKAQDDNLHALKIFTQAFRSPRHAANADRLRPFSSLPGLEVCQRLVVTPLSEKKLVNENPDLNYAVLMPWVNGETWQEFMLAQRPLSQDESLALARSLAFVLANMGQKGIAHCDLSGPNVILTAVPSGQSTTIALVDVDDLYAPGLPRPEKLPGGSLGYAHKTAPHGLWSAEADRFAGAILLVEMLAWCDQQVRKLAYGEQYFAPAEVQEDSKRYQVLMDVLQKCYGGPIEDAFARVWNSETLYDCPTLDEWAKVLEQPSGAADPVPSIQVTAFELPEIPTFKPIFKPIDIEEPDILATHESVIHAKGLVICPSCTVKVLPRPDGTCPSCQESISKDVAENYQKAESDQESNPSQQPGSGTCKWVWLLVVLLGLATLILGILYIGAI